jgi:hypothetical protein
MSTKTYTTLEAGKLMSACPDDERLDLRGVVILDNESGNVQVTLTEDELEEYQDQSGNEINDDVISDEGILLLVEWLEEEEILEQGKTGIMQRYCKKNGLPFKDIGIAYPSLSPEESRRQDIVELAKSQRSSGELEPRGVEIDDDAEVSEGEDNGAYVQVWAWVSFEGTPLDKNPVQENK